MWSCRSCGRTAEEEARFCPSCGARRPARPPPAQQRRVVTVLFADVSGFTALSERLDPETVQDLMSRWFATARPAVEHHGGRVENYLGDAVMAVFGVPAAHEDNALRATRAAREMHTALESLNGELSSRYGVRLAIHAGLNTGEVVAGTSADGDP